MSFTARDILWAVRTALQDTSNTRWTLEEMRVYLNDGLKEIALYKPTATSEMRVMALASGTYQTLPDGVNLLRVIRNITSAVDATPRIAGKIITPIDRAVLDAQFPGWHDTAVVPFSATVLHVMSDEMNPRAFYVYPGNDGTGRIEAIVSTVPAEVAAPGNPLDIDAYTATIDLPDLYENVLRTYVLYRCYEKDSGIPGSAQRAVAHYQQFANALGIKQQVENIANINTDQA